MKKLLPILLCYVLMTSQVFAISGGPVFGGSSLNPIGTYSGVLVGETETDVTDPTTTPPTTTTMPSTALGLFSLSVPPTSVATGAFLLFSNGAIFTGNIDASVDVDSGKLSGIVFGFEFQEEIDAETGDEVEVEVAYAAGQVTAQVGASGKDANSSARISGNSVLSVTFLGGATNSTGQPTPTSTLSFTVSGFRQSLSSSSVSSLPTLTGTGG